MICIFMAINSFPLLLVSVSECGFTRIISRWHADIVMVVSFIQLSELKVRLKFETAKKKPAVNQGLVLVFP